MRSKYPSGNLPAGILLLGFSMGMISCVAPEARPSGMEPARWDLPASTRGGGTSEQDPGAVEEDSGAAPRPETGSASPESHEPGPFTHRPAQPIQGGEVLNGNGVGIMIGSTTGLTFKNWMSARTAMQFGVAWELGTDGEFTLLADYLVYPAHAPLAQGALETISLYTGAGLRLRTIANREDRVGLRIPLGVALIQPRSRFEWFAELAPTLDLAPASDFDLDAGVGIRLFF